MTDQLDGAPHPRDGELRDLLDRRASVQGWLDGLAAQEGKVSDRVLQRVREDYTGRLHHILDALTTHRQAVDDEIQGAKVRLDDAERQYEEAVEQLEEGRLRSMIGELNSETWAERADRLDEAVRQAEEGRQTARAEIARLRELLDQLDERTADTSVAIVPASTPEPSVKLIDEPIDEVQPVAGKGLFMPEGDQEGDGADGEDDIFLGKVDRSLADSQVAIPSEELEPVEDTAPKPGLKCTECGYTNDLSAWFCGVCGADVG